ncbi:MAG TPA: hypothetical protein VF137_09190 [Candidatus Dormibacteraeota bacterium]
MPGALGAAAANAYATSGSVRVDQQAYNWDGAPAPDPNTPPDGNLHVSIANGTTTAHGLIHINFSALPQNAQINDLNLVLTEDTSNVNDTASAQANQQPALEACVLTQPFTTSNTGAPYSCDKYPSVPADFDAAKGTWSMNLQALAATWDKIGNTGAAIVPVAESPNGAHQVPASTATWSITFIPSKTKASVDYSPGSASSSSFESAAGPAPAPALAGGVALAAPPPPVAVPPAPKTSTAAPSTQQGTSSQAPSGVVPLSKIETQKAWLAIAIALVLLAVLLVVGGAGLNLLRTGSLSLAGAGSALSAAWPQVATPAAVILMGAVLAGGFSGRLVTVAAPGSAIGAAGSGGTAAGGASGLPGSAGGAAGAGAAGSAGAAGATGAAGTAGAGGTTSSGGPLPVGVTPTTVRIGFFHSNNVNTINEANGIQGLNNVGNGDAQANAMVDWINKHGGIAGHRVQAVFVNEDASNTDPTYGQQLCTTMTEDEQVFAVIDGNNEDTKTLQCYAQHHTLNINTGLSLFSESQLRQWQPYVWVPEGPSLDRNLIETLSAISQRGFFTPPDAVTKIKPGFVFPNDPDTQNVVTNTVIPYLHQLGYSDSQFDQVSIDVSSGNTGAVLAQINNAALKFDTDSVNRVFFVNDSGAALFAFFARDADNEHYVPRYGLNSQDGLDATGYLVPEEQKVNSISVGYWPWADTSTVNSSGFPNGASESACYQIMNQHGIYSAEPKGKERDGEGMLTIEWTCDALWTLYYGAAQLGQNLSAANVSAAIQGLGNSFQQSDTYFGYTLFGPRHLDGVDYYRYIRFDPSCTTGYDGGTGSPPQGCFKYDGTATYKSPEV